MSQNDLIEKFWLSDKYKLQYGMHKYHPRKFVSPSSLKCWPILADERTTGVTFANALCACVAADARLIVRYVAPKLGTSLWGIDRQFDLLQYCALRICIGYSSQTILYS